MATTPDCKPSRRSDLGAAIAAFALTAVLLATAFGAGLHSAIERIEASLPPVPAPEGIETSAVVLDRNGLLLRPFTTAAGRWRLPVEASQVDKRFIAMLIGYEDKRFYDHHGVDYLALARAGLQLATSGRIISGGSTLTMQVARLLQGHTTRSAAAKLHQIVYAGAIERQLTKQQILNLYLLLAPYGGNLEGVRAAALAYFGKEPRRLTPAQSALLVAIPQAPEARRPDRHHGVAVRARNRVLKRLANAGVLKPDDAAAAPRETVRTARARFPLLAAHAAARANAATTARVHRLTIDTRLQRALETLTAARLGEMDRRLSAAVLVVDHGTGEILASVGSAGLLDTERKGFIDMTRARRSPGSTLKPLIYGLGFEAGLAHPESLIEDRPTGFSGYAPVNFDGRFHGTVTIRQALTASLNVPAVQVLDAVGPARLLARLRRAGAGPKLPDATPAGLAIGLGGIGISLKGLVASYAAIARGGQSVKLLERLTPAGADAADKTAGAVLEPAAAWYVADILRDTPPPANGSAGRFAFKTGTSYGYRDAWAIGFDGRHVVGVWVGRPDGAPSPGLSGILTAAPLLFEAFARIGPERVALKAAPRGVLKTTSAKLPEPLRRFRHPRQQIAARDAEPEIAYPRDGVRVDLGLGGDAKSVPLAIKVRYGEPPFTWLINGAPVARTGFERSASWIPDGVGFVTISVIDAAGHSDRVTVFLQ